MNIQHSQWEMILEKVPHYRWPYVFWHKTALLEGTAIGSHLHLSLHILPQHLASQEGLKPRKHGAWGGPWGWGTLWAAGNSPKLLSLTTTKPKRLVPQLVRPSQNSMDAWHVHPRKSHCTGKKSLHSLWVCVSPSVLISKLILKAGLIPSLMKQPRNTKTKMI